MRHLNATELLAQRANMGKCIDQTWGSNFALVMLTLYEKTTLDRDGLWEFAQLYGEEFEDFCLRTDDFKKRYDQMVADTGIEVILKNHHMVVHDLRGEKNTDEVEKLK